MKKKRIVKKRKRRLRKSIRYTLYVLGTLLILALVLNIFKFNIHFVGKSSINDGALKYQDKHCLVFYPESNNGKRYARKLCEEAEKDAVIDYSIEKKGNYNLVSYPDGTSYYLDVNNNELLIENISEEGKYIVSDYLRYSMKKAELDQAYTYDFLIETKAENIDLNEFVIEVNGDDLKFNYKKYDFDFYIPLKYMQEAIDVNLGYTNEEYIKPRYVSKDRKKICFTFDDGPDMSLRTSGQIVDKLYELDSSATFFVLGHRLGPNQINYIKESVEKGMEYGSHTQNHKNLTKLDSYEIQNEVMIPYHDLKDNEYGFGYSMKTFRPPYGSINQTVRESVDLLPILWNVDSLDWDYRSRYEYDEAVDAITKKVINDADENDVVLMHDIYATSADAACRLIEHFIKEGYQVVNVSELIEALDLKDISSFSGR